MNDTVKKRPDRSHSHPRKQYKGEELNDDNTCTFLESAYSFLLCIENTYHTDQTELVK